MDGQTDALEPGGALDGQWLGFQFPASLHPTITC